MDRKLFSGSPLDLPTAVFAGAVALGLSSYILGIHNLTIANADGHLKQHGFMWAPNWTLLFMVLMPLYFVFVIDLVVFWKNEKRQKLLAGAGREESKNGWTHRVEGSRYTYWSVLIICVGFAGVFQWVGVRLVPLTGGGGDYATDWGTLALIRPDVISVQQAIAFTGLAYLYMSLCFYLFFAGLILLYTLVYDVWEIGSQSDIASQIEEEIKLKVLRGIFRCTLLGVLAAICMKLQSSYVSSSATSIVDFLVWDMTTAFKGGDGITDKTTFRSPTHYTSLVVALAACIPFLYVTVRIGNNSSLHYRWQNMAMVVALLVLSYLLTGTSTGFSILLCLGLLTAIYGLFNPAFRQKTEIE